MKTRPRIYQWESWFGQREFVLVAGRDYHCSQSSIVQQVRNAASFRGVSVKIEEQRNGIKVEVLDADDSNQRDLLRD